MLNLPIDQLQNLSLDSLNSSDRAEAEKLLKAIRKKSQTEKLLTFYPLQGNYRRDLYPKHIEFFHAGAVHNERCFMGGNRVGKTTVGGYETTLHLTGLYPDWWTGRRFDHAIEAWAAGKTTETTRDIVQQKLFGELIHEGNRKRFTGTGMIPQALIMQDDLSWKPGLPDLCDVAKIRHVSGEFSKIGMKTYQQGRGSFEGTEKHVIWIDEEPPVDVYEECMMRLMTVDGIMMVTFTPLEGMSDVVMQFLNIKPEEPPKNAEDYL